MNLLITGGAGFIGSNVIHHLIGQSEIKKLVNMDALTYAGHLENLKGLEDKDRYFFEHADLRDKRKVLDIVRTHDITHVMHLAAESHVDRSITGPDDFIETNVLGTFHLLEACRCTWGSELGDKRFHHVSTDEVYGTLGPEGAFSETSPYAPNSPYAASKAASDLIVRSYHHTYGLPTVVTNCSNNYGPYQYPEKLIPVVIDALVHRKPIPVYGDGMNVRDWLFVRDHAEALWQVMRKGKLGETYNIGGENEWPNLPMIETMCDIFDELSSSNGGNSRKLIAFVKDRPGHDRRYAIDPTKIRTELGWQPATSFSEGLRETIQWYLNHQEWVKKVMKGR